MLFMSTNNITVRNKCPIFTEFHHQKIVFTIVDESIFYRYPEYSPILTFFLMETIIFESLPISHFNENGVNRLGS